MNQFDNGIDADKPKQERLFELAECFRSATDPEEVRRLGDQIGRTGGMHRWMQKIFDGSP